MKGSWYVAILVDSGAILYRATEHDSQCKAGVSYTVQLSARYGHILSCKKKRHISSYNAIYGTRK